MTGHEKLLRLVNDENDLEPCYIKYKDIITITAGYKEDRSIDISTLTDTHGDTHCFTMSPDLLVKQIDKQLFENELNDKIEKQLND